MQLPLFAPGGDVPIEPVLTRQESKRDEDNASGDVGAEECGLVPAGLGEDEMASLQLAYSSGDKNQADGYEE